MDPVRIPRVLIAGVHSGVGKTTVTMGILLALRAAGKSPQPFKVGPDYIDPGFLSFTAGRTCRNLDSWLIPAPRLLDSFRRACAGAGMAVVEGVMGLYDGLGPTGERGSTAEMAKLLDCPVILVLDASALSRSAAAIVKGYLEFDRGVRLAGCFLNRVGSSGHARLVKEGIERLTGVPVIGFLAKEERLQLPERHLGLVPTAENHPWRKTLPLLAQRIKEGLELSALQRIARQAGPLQVPEPTGLQAERVSSAPRRVVGLPRSFCPEMSREAGLPLAPAAARVPIAVARDEAFHFYYPENLELLERLGAELVPFSPLRDERLPRGAAGVYLGGGFPELHAAQLSKNRALHQALRQAAGRGMPVYAECGGLMLLSSAIGGVGGRFYRMAGLVPGRVRMTDRLQNFGYQEVAACRDSILARKGERARGHEFHHSVLERPPVRGRAGAAYEICAPRGQAKRLEGFAKGALLASYIHLHFLNQPRWAGRFVQAARKWERESAGK